MKTRRENMVHVFIILICLFNGFSNGEDFKCPHPCRCDPDRKIVFCNGKELIHVPFGIPKNTRILNLKDNMIISSPTLDAVLSGLKNLETLDLSDNQLTSLPKHLPKSLKRILLKSNNVKYIGIEALKGMRSLVVIRLDNNSITNEGLARSAFTGATNLTTLTLTKNKLTAIPSGLPYNLKLLHLNKNNIKQIRVINVRGLTKIIGLDLSENQLTDEGIQENSISSMNSLEHLNLNSNYLRDVPYGLPETLTDLSLANNQIRYIYARQPATIKHKKVGTFQLLTELKKLDLSNNLLQSIESDSFSSMNKLYLILFHSNRWSCDCHLKYFLEFISSPNLIKNDMKHIICVTPSILEGVTINNLDSDALICNENLRNFSTIIDKTGSDSVTFNWTKQNFETVPPFVRNYAMYGALKCKYKYGHNDCEMNRDNVVFSPGFEAEYKELDVFYRRRSEGTGKLDNLKSNKIYLLCLFDSSTMSSRISYDQCVEFQTLPEMSAIHSEVLPIWIIIVCTASIFVVAMSGFALLIHRKRKQAKFLGTNDLSSEGSKSVDRYQRQYVGQLLRKEGVVTENEVILRNHLNSHDKDADCRKSTTLDAAKEFNVTLLNHKNGVRMSTISTTTRAESLYNKYNNNDESMSSCRTTTSTIGSSHENSYFTSQTEPRVQDFRRKFTNICNMNGYFSQQQPVFIATAYSTGTDNFRRSTGVYV